MSPEASESLRAELFAEVPFISDEIIGIKASGGEKDRFGGVSFARDAFISIILALQEPQNADVPNLLNLAKMSQRFLISFQGKETNSRTEEAEGKIPHEIHTGISFQQRLAEMKIGGWPVYELKDKRLGMVYYGAGDSTALFNISVAVVYRALALKDRQHARSYLEEMWPHVKAAFKHDIEIGDLDKDGLIESNPQNEKALLNHTWKDSNDAYRDEEGRMPKPPYKYLTNNSYFLWSLREGATLAREMREDVFAAELENRYERGKKQLHDLFWMPDLGTYAPLIDGEGNQVKFISDDPVIALWAQVIEPEFAKRVIARLKEPDMNTAWGLRTRSSESPLFAVNGAEAYHNGTVWLHQTFIAAKAVENYGDTEFAGLLDREAFEFQKRLKREELAAVGKEGDRLDRYEEVGVPVACNPQAWGVLGALARTAKTAKAA